MRAVLDLLANCLTGLFLDLGWVSFLKPAIARERPHWADEKWRPPRVTAAQRLRNIRGSFRFGRSNSSNSSNNGDSSHGMAAPVSGLGASTMTNAGPRYRLKSGNNGPSLGTSPLSATPTDSNSSRNSDSGSVPMALPLEDEEPMDRYSFPSGHATRSVYLALFAHYVCTERELLPTWVAHGVAAWAVAVSVSRVLIGRHRVLEVLLGGVVGWANYSFLRALWLSPKVMLPHRARLLSAFFLP